MTTLTVLFCPDTLPSSPSTTPSCDTYLLSLPHVDSKSMKLYLQGWSKIQEVGKKGKNDIDWRHQKSWSRVWSLFSGHFSMSEQSYYSVRSRLIWHFFSWPVLEQFLLYRHRKVRHFTHSWRLIICAWDTFVLEIHKFLWIVFDPKASFWKRDLTGSPWWRLPWPCILPYPPINTLMYRCITWGNVYHIIINQFIIVGKGLVSSEWDSKYIEQNYNLIPSEYLQIFFGIYVMSHHDKTTFGECEEFKTKQF
jgi:hypothetical protein